MKRTVGLIGLMIILTATTGCLTSRFPYYGSHDRHNFASTTTTPLNVKLKDVITGEHVLDIDVPVRQMLVIDLEHQEDYTAGIYNAYPAEKVSWELLPVGTVFPGHLANEMKLPGNPVLLKVTVREATAGEGGSMTYQPVEGAPSDDAPSYTPQGPATRDVGETPAVEVQDTPQPETTPAVETETDTGTSSTPKYTPTESTDDLEGALE